MTSLRPRLIASLAVDEAEKERALEAALELSAVLSGVGADLLSAAGALSALYSRDLPPDYLILKTVRGALDRGRQAVDEFGARGGKNDG